jgi:aspartyl-tRNA(Asn)/glutamyl-tRNA(Gln) amidotransferase subunit C
VELADNCAVTPLHERTIARCFHGIKTFNFSKRSKYFKNILTFFPPRTWRLETWLHFPTLPPMSHRHIDVRYVANLARLELTDDEIATFQPQLEAILGHVEALSKLDVSGIDPTAHATAVFGKMRDDVPHTSLSPEAVLQNAPDQAQGQIRVPKVVTDA